jgi:hypothetical protein
LVELLKCLVAKHELTHKEIIGAYAKRRTKLAFPNWSRPSKTCVGARDLLPNRLPASH